LHTLGSFGLDGLAQAFARSFDALTAAEIFSRV
jgi:hypothetical protein